MNRQVLLPALLALAACASVPAPMVDAPTTTDVPAPHDLQAFAVGVESLRVARRIPGLSIAVVEDGAVVFARGFGHADLERRIPATPDTPYNIASVSKPLSAVVALRLAEAGVLSLDAPMADGSDWAAFCRDFGAQPTIFARGLRCDPPVHTLRHLLTHTAREPAGTTFSYNPVLYSWASRPMMRATGEGFSALVDRHVLQPAGMARSARTYRELPLRADLAAAMARPYAIGADGAPLRAPDPPPQGDGAAGGVVSTVLDLARFDIALDRGALLGPVAYAEMMAPATTAGGQRLPYALGWFAQRQDGRELRWHSGLWEGAYSALYLKVPEQRLTLIVLANSDGLWWDNPLDAARVQDAAIARLFLETFVAR